MLSYKHYYLICLNMKTKSWEVIDNIVHGKAATKEYGGKLNKLVRFHKLPSKLHYYKLYLTMNVTR